MKVIAVNGSPRKNWNTHILLEKCLDGAKEIGAETELINLYDMNFKGCTSCFACKRKGITIDKCAMKDEMKSFLERLLFPYSSYEGKPSSFGKKINTAFIYTMNAPSFALPLIGYNKLIKENKKLMIRIFGSSESLAVTSTYQFDDYSKYAMTLFDGAKRLKRRETVFVEDCKKAFLLGKKLCENEKK